MKDDNSGKSVVFVVDDDPLVRGSLSSLLRSVGLQTRVFASTSEFLQEKRPPLPSCLVLDVRLPGVSGLDFQAELSGRNIHIPIIFMTGHGDIPMRVRAMKARRAGIPDQAFSRLERMRRTQAPAMTAIGRHRSIATDVRFGQSLFQNHVLRGRHRSGRARGNGECQPRIPSRRTVGCTEFAVSPQTQEALHVSHREVISDLRADTENA